MMSIYCKEHLKEQRDKFEAAKKDNPVLTVREWVGSGLVFDREKFDACPNCYYTGLSKQGVLGKLESQEDWLWS